MSNQLTRAYIEQVQTSLRGHPLEPIITLALDSGMRRDELLRLTWQDLDLEQRQVRILNSKTQRGERLLPLSESLTRVLRQHAARQRGACLQAGRDWQDGNLVFSDAHGKALGSQQLLQGWYELCKQAGLPRLRFHELRLSRWRSLISGETEEGSKQ